MNELTREQVVKDCEFLAVEHPAHASALDATDAALRRQIEALEKELARVQGPPNQVGALMWYCAECLRMRKVISEFCVLEESLKHHLAKVASGHCLKCSMGPQLTSCAYPEACEHPGRELAKILNTTMLELAQVTTRCRELEECLSQRSNIISEK